MNVVEFLITLIAGLIVGAAITVIVSKVRNKHKFCGDLLIFQDQDDGPYFCLALNETINVNSLVNEDSVMLKVVPK